MSRPQQSSCRPKPSRLNRAREAGLIAAARDGDKRALEQLTADHLPLVRRIAFRHHSPNGTDELDDLIQVGMIGLIESIDRFEAARGRFAPYAAATVSGTIKRHFRDRGWRIHIPRSLHDAAQRVSAACAELEGELGRPPTDAELEAKTSIPLDRIAEARALLGAAMPLSLEAPAGEGGSTLDEAVGKADEGFARAEQRALISTLTSKLGERDLRVLALRFGLDRTQTEIANAIGVSQMQVSRVLRRVVGAMRGEAEVAEAVVEEESRSPSA